MTFPCHDPLDSDEAEFYGREQELGQIDEVPNLSTDGMIRQQVYGLYGMAGVGKSKLVRTYANRFKRHFDAIFVVQSENPMSVSQSFSRIARKLRLCEQDQAGNAEEDNKSAQQWLLETADNGKCDNSRA